MFACVTAGLSTAGSERPARTHDGTAGPAAGAARQRRRRHGGRARNSTISTRERRIRSTVRTAARAQVSIRDWHEVVTLSCRMPYTSRPEPRPGVLVQGLRGARSRPLEAIVREPRTANGEALLDVGCGRPASTLEHLHARFACGRDTDIDEGLSAHRAGERVPDVPLQQADMRDFDLGRRSSTWSRASSARSASSAKPRRARRGRQAGFARHLEPAAASRSSSRGSRPDVWIPNKPHLLTHEETGARACPRHAQRPTRTSAISTTDMHYVVATPTGVEHSSRTTSSSLFTNDEMRSAFEAGLTVDYDAAGLAGRGLWICSR